MSIRPWLFALPIVGLLVAATAPASVCVFGIDLYAKALGQIKLTRAFDPSSLGNNVKEDLAQDKNHLLSRDGSSMALNENRRLVVRTTGSGTAIAAMESNDESLIQLTEDWVLSTSADGKEVFLRNPFDLEVFHHYSSADSAVHATVDESGRYLVLQFGQMCSVRETSLEAENEDDRARVVARFSLTSLSQIGGVSIPSNLFESIQNMFYFRGAGILAIERRETLDDRSVQAQVDLILTGPQEGGGIYLGNIETEINPDHLRMSEEDYNSVAFYAPIRLLPSRAVRGAFNSKRPKLKRGLQAGSHHLATVFAKVMDDINYGIIMVTELGRASPIFNLKLVFTNNLNPNTINSVRLSPDQRYVAIGSDSGHVYVYETSSPHRLVYSERVFSAGMARLRWRDATPNSKDSRLVMLANDGEVQFLTLTPPDHLESPGA